MYQLFRKSQSRQNPNDTIELRGLNKTVLWGELDRWDYSNPDVPSGTPPPYTLYTFLTLGEAFQVFLVIMAAHTLAMLITKLATSREFRTRRNLIGKLIHVIQNLSLATPYQDWDEGVHSMPEYKRRFRRTNIEMSCCLVLNIVVSLLLTVPLWYTGGSVDDFHLQKNKKNM